MRQEVVVRARRHEARYERELEEKLTTALSWQSAEMVAQSQALDLQALQFSEQAVTHVAQHQTQYLDLMENELREHMVMMRNEDAQKEEAFQYQMSVELAIRVQEHSNQVLAVQRNEVHEIELAAYRRLQSAITNEQERFAQSILWKIVLGTVSRNCTIDSFGLMIDISLSFNRSEENLCSKHED
jgi:hypothetical protein